MPRFRKMDYVIGLNLKYEWRLEDGKISNEEFDQLLCSTVKTYLGYDLPKYYEARNKYLEKIYEEEPNFSLYSLAKSANEANEILEKHKDVFLKMRKEQAEKALGPSIDEASVERLQKKADKLKKKKEDEQKKSLRTSKKSSKGKPL